jgi:S1-C subfamily serine protease
MIIASRAKFGFTTGCIAMVLRRRFSIFLLLGAAIPGCVAEGLDEKKLKTQASNIAVIARQPVAFDASKSQPIGLAKVQFRIPRGTVVARYPWVFLQCNTDSYYAFETLEAVWGSGPFNTRDLTFNDLFYEVMEEKDFPVVGDPSRLFDVREERKRAVYEVGAQVTGLSMEICQLASAWDGRMSGRKRGTAEIDVRWQVYSKLERRVVFEVKTKGKAALVRAQVGGEGVLMDQAFLDAAHQLSQDKRFFAAVQRDPRDEANSSLAAVRDKGKTFAIPPTKLRSGRMADYIDTIRGATVTITATGGGHGSGFFIHRSGYLLTNAHVVGDAKFVRIELLTGRAVLGEVLRTDKRRDVALVEVEEGGFPALAVRRRPAVVSEEVFAVGTPIDRALRSTVTRGVVSGFRTSERSGGLKEIQADVDIQGGSSGGPLVDGSGNVVGITVAGIGVQQLSAGLNFFVPIVDALKFLNIELKKRKISAR